jgi:GNAT superfamily N-acetyltransferase
MPFRPKLRSRLALAERTIAEALRVFAPAGAHLDSRLVQIAPAPDMPADRSVLVVADERTLQPEPPASAMLVYEPGGAALSTLRFDVGAADWERQVGAAAQHRIGAIRGGVLIAVASMDPPEGRLARIRVLVSPTFRQRGFGHLVLHRLATRVLHGGLFPYARLAAHDLTARALAARTGFVTLARQMSVMGMPPSFA